MQTGSLTEITGKNLCNMYHFDSNDLIGAIVTATM
jgi:hypothetical protein